MAGIGFELKKLFSKRGLFASFRAYGYSAVICAGPMLLGVLLLLGVMLLCSWFGTAEADQDLLVSMITYTLLASQLLTSFFSMVVTRYISDMLYAERTQDVLPCFWGSSDIMLLLGAPLYGIFLYFSGATLVQGLLCMWFFVLLIVVWNAMSFLTALKDYQGIFRSFFTAVLVTFLVGFGLLWLGLPAIESLLFAVTVGYGLMMTWDVLLLYRYFPKNERRPFQFLSWIDQFLPLAFTGLFTSLGMFGHLVIMWAGPIGEQIKGLFYGAPWYDVPALLAFMTTLVTTVNFVVSVEVKFYPRYRDYYSLFNDKGSIRDICQAEAEMLKVLQGELKYTALKQLFTTAIVLSVGGYVLQWLPLGFNDIMEGYFRTLCVGYGMYAVGNTLMLLLLYFTDYRGSVTVTLIFAVCTNLFTVLSLRFDRKFYGFGFLLGCAVFFAVSVVRLEIFTRHLPYHVLSEQPIVAREKTGIFTRLGQSLDGLSERSLQHEEKKNKSA